MITKLKMNNVIFLNICQLPLIVCKEAAGIVSRTVLNSQITASSAYNDSYAPRNARLETLGRLMPGWMASPDDADPWIQVSLVRVFTLKSILTQGCQNSDSWTTEYKLQYWDLPSLEILYILARDTGNVKVWKKKV